MADGPTGAETGVGSPGVEAGRSPELKKDTRAEVKEALNKALESLRQEASKPTTTDELRLALKSVADAKKGSLDNPGGEKDTYTVLLHEGDPTKEKPQEEGIPVEDLLKHIKDKINLTPKDTPEGKSARRELYRIGRILYRNSQRYSEAHNMTGEDYIGRVRVEAKYIAGDDNRRSKEAVDETRMKADYHQAEDVLVGIDRDKQKYKSERAW
ncbi:MAG: hypothetical protein Q7S88_02785, partial [Candidatus Daviesbacteria bacterium]|nr:hypothetical protein [Candidatus Daviesbacteria bacterium]